MKYKGLIATAACAIVLAAAGCSDNNNSGSSGKTVSFGAKAALGALRNATCTVTTFPGGTSLDGPFTTNADGVVVFGDVIFATPAPNLLISCTQGSYYDEARDSEYPLGSSVIRTIVPSSRINLATDGGALAVAVTSYTEIATALALNNDPTSPSADTIEDALAAVATMAGIPGVDLLTPPTTVSQNAKISASTPSDLYAAALAGLAFAAKTAGSPNVGEYTVTLSQTVAGGNNISASIINAIDAGTDTAAADPNVTNPQATPALQNAVNQQQQAAGSPGDRGRVQDPTGGISG